MKTIDLLRRSGRSLKHAKARTLLTSLAIAVGAFTITISLAAGEGARQYADKIISSNVDPRAILVAKDDSLFGEGQQSDAPQAYDPDATSLGEGGPTVKRLTNDDLQKILKTKGVESAAPSYDVTIKYLFANDQPDKKFVGDVAAYDSTILTELTAGKLPPLRTDIKNNEVTLPNSFVSVLGFKSAKAAIGQKISLHLERPLQIDSAKINEIIQTQGLAGLQNLPTAETKEVSLTIVAVTKNSALSIHGSNSLAISGSTAKELSEFLTKGTDDFQKYLVFNVIAKADADVDSVKSALEKQGYAATTAKDLQKLLFTFVNVLQSIVLGFGVIALIASVFGIINTMYISVLERTQQIGLMKALGMRSFNVMQLFLFEAGWIGLIGGAVGAALAYLAGTLMNPWITDKLSLGEANHLLIFKPIPILILLLGLILVGVISGLLPARKAAKLDPIEALRTE